jgi:hypothetical protein
VKFRPARQHARQGRVSLVRINTTMKTDLSFPILTVVILTGVVVALASPAPATDTVAMATDGMATATAPDVTGS